MQINPELIVHSFTSFSYSWIPALLILWFLISLKPQTKLLVAFMGFLAGAVLSSLAGHLNHFASLHLPQSEDSPIFFLVVGINEESIKFIASAATLFIMSQQNWRKVLQTNWLALIMSGALGFAASENFIYGIDGQGGIARVIPLIAHTFFAVFWGIGLYKASWCNNKSKAIAWTLFGLFEGVLWHALYDCVVSENIIPNGWKIIAWLLISIILFVLLRWHFSIIKNLKKDNLNLEIIENSPINSTLAEKKVGMAEFIISICMPGIGHFARKEYFTGLTFFALSILLPYIILRFGANEIIKAASQEINFKTLFLLFQIFLIIIAVFFTIGLWSAWELKQRNKKPEEKTNLKKRFTSLFPVSTLFFVSLLCSFFLPAFEKPKNKKDGEDKTVVIKEIPLGITWDIEKTIAPAPQKTINKPIGTKESINSISLDEKPDKDPNQKSLKDIKDPSQDKPPSGVQNSDSLNQKNLPKKLPPLGYIGVQLAEVIGSNQEVKPYIAFVYPGTSAERAGLQSGDLIISVDGKKVKGLTVLDVSNMVRGTLGTSVEIIVLREGFGEVKIKAYRTGSLFQAENDESIKP